MKEEDDSDICRKTGAKFLGTKEEAKKCEECEYCKTCPVLNLSRRVRIVEGKMDDVICPETGDMIRHSSKCVECQDNETCLALNL